MDHGPSFHEESSWEKFMARIDAFVIDLLKEKPRNPPAHIIASVRREAEDLLFRERFQRSTPVIHSHGVVVERLKVRLKEREQSASE
jgi:hypothetical protein